MIEGLSPDRCRYLMGILGNMPATPVNRELYDAFEAAAERVVQKEADPRGVIWGAIRPFLTCLEPVLHIDRKQAMAEADVMAAEIADAIGAALAATGPRPDPEPTTPCADDVEALLAERDALAAALSETVDALTLIHHENRYGNNCEPAGPCPTSAVIRRARAALAGSGEKPA